MHKLSRTGRVATLAAAASLLAGGAAVAAQQAGPTPNPAPSRAPMSVPAPGAPGQDLTFHAVAPCRIVDTRYGGGPLLNATRQFESRTGLAAQGGNAAGCGIPATAQAIQVNLGAVPVSGSSGYVKGWEAGQTEPLASLLNFSRTATANMVTLPVSSAQQFVLRVAGSSDVFADVAGYYTSPLYVAVAPDGTVYQGVASGVVSVSKASVGNYVVTFDRNVTRCAPVAGTYLWSANTDPSADNNPGYGGNVVRVGVTNTANAYVDDWFYLSLTC